MASCRRIHIKKHPVQLYSNFFQKLDANLAELTAKFEKATADKLKCQQEADATNNTINLANRLVGGLASENVRWAEAIEGFKVQVKLTTFYLTDCYN